MMKEQTYAGIVDAIYDASVDFERWPVALDHIAKTFHCSYVGLIDRNLATMEGRAAAIGIDAAGQREYFEVWSEHDLLRKNTQRYRPGAIETDQDIMPRRDLVCSEYYNAFLKPRDMHAVLRVTLAAKSDFLKIMSLSRPQSLGDFEASDIEQFESLVPHLQRAARITQQVEQSNLNLNAFSHLMEQSVTGVLLLDDAGKILFANRAARTMAQAKEGFVLRSASIEALDRENAATLRRLIADAIGRPRLTAGHGGAMRLRRESNKSDLTVTVAPLGTRHAWPTSRPVAFVLITDPDAAMLRSTATMVKVFGLSAPEARVAERLLLGDSPEDAAANLGLKISTIRWHLASMYRKTGTGGQLQLVRQLLSVPEQAV